MFKPACIKTSENHYSLQIQDPQLSLLADLLNSVNDFRADALRDAVNKTIRGNRAFTLLITRKIISCSSCNATGNILRQDDFDNTLHLETCSECRGMRQRVEISSLRYEPFSPFWADELAPIK
jgi:hypothetical protein